MLPHHHTDFGICMNVFLPSPQYNDSELKFKVFLIALKMDVFVKGSRKKISSKIYPAKPRESA